MRHSRICCKNAKYLPPPMSGRLHSVQARAAGDKLLRQHWQLGIAAHVTDRLLPALENPVLDCHAIQIVNAGYTNNHSDENAGRKCPQSWMPSAHLKELKASKNISYVIKNPPHKKI